MNDIESSSAWDSGLQPERTSLAWRRLALALLGMAVAVLKLSWPAMGAWALAPAGIVAAGAVTLMAASHRRYLNTHEAVAPGGALFLPDGRLPLVAVLAALALGAVGVAIVAVR